MADRTIEVKVTQQGSAPGTAPAGQLPPPPPPPGPIYGPQPYMGKMWPGHQSPFYGFTPYGNQGFGPHMMPNPVYGPQPYMGQMGQGASGTPFFNWMPHAQGMGVGPHMRAQIPSGGMFQWNSMLAGGHMAIGAASAGALGLGAIGAGVGMTYQHHLARNSYNPYGIQNPYASGDAWWNTINSGISGAGNFVRNSVPLVGGLMAAPLDLAQGAVDLSRNLFTNIEERRRTPQWSAARYEDQDRLSRQFETQSDARVKIEQSQERIRTDRARVVTEGAVADRFSDMTPGGEFFTRKDVLGVSTSDTGRVKRALAEAEVRHNNSFRSVAAAENARNNAKFDVFAAQNEYNEVAGIRTDIEIGLQNWENGLGVDPRIGKMVGYQEGGWLNGRTGPETKFGQMASGMLARYDRIMEESRTKLQGMKGRKDAADKDFQKELQRQNDLQYNYDLAKLDVQRDSLNASRRHEEVIKGGTIQYETMMPGEQRYLLYAAEKLQQEGVGATNPRMKSALLSNQWTREWASRKFEEQGGADDTARKIKSIAGVGDLNEVRNQGDKIEADVIKQEMKVKADHQNRLQKINEVFAKEAEDAIQKLADILVQKIKDEEARLRRERAEQIKAGGGAP